MPRHFRHVQSLAFCPPRREQASRPRETSESSEKTFDRVPSLSGASLSFNLAQAALALPRRTPCDPPAVTPRRLFSGSGGWGVFRASSSSLFILTPDKTHRLRRNWTRGSCFVLALLSGAAINQMIYCVSDGPSSIGFTTRGRVAVVWGSRSAGRGGEDPALSMMIPEGFFFGVILCPE